MSCNSNNSNNDDKFVRSVMATAENLSRVAICNDLSRSRKDSESKMDLALLRASLADAERSARAQLLEEQRCRGGGGDDSAGYSAYASSKEDSEDDFEQPDVEEEEIVKPNDDSLSKKKVAIRTAKKLSKRSSSTFVPPKQLLLYLVRMGSFTSTPKVLPNTNADDGDAEYAADGAREDVATCLDRCDRHLKGLPRAIERQWQQVEEEEQDQNKDEVTEDKEKFTVMQWNVLSQALGTKNDNFVRCPASALHWRTRRYRMLEEIVRHTPDIVCLQEVDHFQFLQRSLASLGYRGMFLPKPDSPCLYLADNTGPDGCAIFYNADKFEMEASAKRVIEVWHVESNQVCLTARLRSRKTDNRVIVATTHLKARNGALLSTLRNEQGKDLLSFLSEQVHLAKSSSSSPSSTPPSIVLTGDFNAEPDEPVYTTITEDDDIRLRSAYAAASPSGAEPAYTTWKIREDGEHVQTLDYIFHSDGNNGSEDSNEDDDSALKVTRVLNFPTGEEMGPGRLPSEAYASDHLSLMAEFAFPKKKD